jgi:HlyD family secretion protein
MTETARRRVPIARLVLVVVLVGAGAFGYVRWRDARAKPTAPPTYAGNVDIRDVTLSFRAAGRVNAAFKREGDAVRKGETLARLDPEPYNVALAQAKSLWSTRELRRAVARDGRAAPHAAITRRLRYLAA